MEDGEERSEGRGKEVCHPVGKKNCLVKWLTIKSIVAKTKLLPLISHSPHQE